MNENEYERELRVRKIKDGTVIDHIPAGKALAVMKILGLTGKEGNTISIVMNVGSKKLGKKDVLKIEKKELRSKEVNAIALIAPSATINIIRDYKVVRKYKVRVPKEITKAIHCSNPACITNYREPTIPKFKVIKTNPLILKCMYCGRYTLEDDVIKQFEVSTA